MLASWLVMFVNTYLWVTPFSSCHRGLASVKDFGLSQHTIVSMTVS